MRAINATFMRHNNRKLLLNLIRQRPISRAELAEVTNLTRASVTQIIDELINEGIVIETSVVVRSRLGRRSTQLAIEPNSGAVFGVNLGKDYCDIGAINMNGDVLAHNIEQASGRSAAEVIEAITNTIARQREQLPIPSKRMLGIGLCIPAPVNIETGKILQSENFELWHDIPVAQLLSERTGLPVHIENTANALALSEHFFGSRRDNFALLSVDDVVCAGVLLNGRLYHGTPGLAVLPGDLIIDINDCGRTLRRFFSAPGLLRDAPWKTYSELMQNMDDPLAAELINRLVKALAFSVCNIIRIFAVPYVYIDGLNIENTEEIFRRVNADVLSVIQLPDAPFHPVHASPKVRTAATVHLHTIFAN